jgi:acetyl esterase/lipase
MTWDSVPDKKGERIKMGNKPADFNSLQFVRDIFFTSNDMHVDARFVIRDGKRHPLAVICPGGGYETVCSFIEGLPFARKLNEKAISALIVYYRVREKAHYPAPLEDLARAIGLILKRKDRYLLDPEGYSLWGSSAGGHLAASFGLEDRGWGKYGLPKPGTVILAYPVISMRKELTHMGSHDNLLGLDASSDLEAFASVDEQVGEDYPPAYIWCGEADQTVQPENTKRMARALEEKGVPFFLETFPGIDHGVGPGTGTAAEGWIDRAVSFWLEQRQQRQNASE